MPGHSIRRKLSRAFGFDHLPPEEIEYRVLAMVLIGAVGLLDLAYNFTYYCFGKPFTLWTSTVYLVASAINLSAFRKRGNYRFFRNVQLLLTILMPLSAQLLHGGFTGGSGAVMVAFLAPLGALILSSRRTARRYFVFFLAALVLAGLAEFFFPPLDHDIPRALNLLFFVFNFGFTAAVAFFLLESFLKNKSQAQKLLHREYQKSDALLLNILPTEIALELKERGQVQAKRFDQASVLFTDFIGFSSFARTLSAEELVEQIDFFFRGFDEIVRRRGLEKIKTIGDSYMCAAGIPTATDDHATQIVRAALEMRDFLHRYRDEKEQRFGYAFDVRIGIHTGPVVAGVVGSTKTAYDIWGETVNIAARMEQACEPGRINISEATYQLIKHEFDCHYRGRFPAKHIGEVDMFFVEEKCL